jgi:hypothetical protein
VPGGAFTAGAWAMLRLAIKRNKTNDSFLAMRKLLQERKPLGIGVCRSKSPIFLNSNQKVFFFAIGKSQNFYLIA